MPWLASCNRLKVDYALGLQKSAELRRFLQDEE